MQILFVKNLPSNLTKYDLQMELKKVGEQFGEVDNVSIVINKEIKKPTAFVTFKDLDASKRQSVLDVFGQVKIGEMRVVANWKQSAQERKLQQMKAPVSTKSGNLHLKSLAATTTEKDLLEVFSPFGVLINVSLKQNENYSTSQAWVNFQSRKDSDKALAAKSEQIKALFMNATIDMDYHRPRLTTE